MIDLSKSKDNAIRLVDIFLEQGLEPKFMEFLHFKNCFIDAEFFGYGVEYVIKHFKIYVGFIEDDYCEQVECSVYGKLNLVKTCRLVCDGRDFISEADKKGLAFTIQNGKLRLVKKEERREPLEVEYDTYSYYANKAPKTSN